MFFRSIFSSASLNQLFSLLTKTFVTSDSDDVKSLNILPLDRLLFMEVWLRSTCCHGNEVLDQSCINALQKTHKVVKNATRIESGDHLENQRITGELMRDENVKINTSSAAAAQARTDVTANVNPSSSLLKPQAHNSDAMVSASLLLRVVTRSAIGQFECNVNTSKSRENCGWSGLWMACVQAALLLNILLLKSKNIQSSASDSLQASQSVVSFTCEFLEQATSACDVSAIHNLCDVMRPNLRELRDTVNVDDRKIINTFLKELENAMNVR